MAMLTLLVARLALRDPPPPAMAPSLWIPLAPAGIVGLATLRLLQAARPRVPGSPAPAPGLIVAAMGLGFGLWWAAFATLELRRMRSTGSPPVHPGWWGFVFPVGAMTLSVSAIGAATGRAGGAGARPARHLRPGPLWGYVAAHHVLRCFAGALTRTLPMTRPPTGGLQWTPADGRSP